MDAYFHDSVMLAECVAGLNIKPNGIYVDGTFGGGGHSQAILQRLGAEGRLIAFDQDGTVVQHVIQDSRFELIASNFRYVPHFLKYKKIKNVDGILVDLGLSSYHLDTPERGFSIKNDTSLLDMRMDRRQSLTAREVLNTYSQKALADVFFYYGELLNSRQLATAIVQYRETKTIDHVGDVKMAIYKNIKGIETKYLTRVFQALRIEVNDELGALKALMAASYSVLNPMGRLVVLSFHSLEDRIVKRTMKNEDVDTGDKLETTNFKMLTAKPTLSQQAELHKNPRSHSAKLRIAEKI